LKIIRLGILLLSVLAGAAGLRAQPSFVESAFSTATLAKFSLGSLYGQATDQVPKWGSGAAGFEKRAAWRMAGLLSRTAAEYSVARLQGTDPRYDRCRCKGFLPRSRHALVSEFSVAPSARFTGIAATVGVTSLGQHSAIGDAGKRGIVLVGTDIGFNFLQEFWPEIKRTLSRRTFHTPPF
jgi:hypothetical protein